MRAEVVLLDRSITITADVNYVYDPEYKGPDEEYWGCRVLISDYMDAENGVPIYRRANATMDYVEIKHCSQ
jgi:hypothetical protein